MRRVTANHDEADATRRHPARRGAALVLVLIFTAGALMLVSTLLAVTTNQAQATAEHHRQQSLHAVLRAGIAAAVNEINRDQTAGPYDPGNDGVGALLGPAGPDGLREGVSVVAPGGRSLGRYRTTLRKDGDRIILTVLAASPDFRRPARLLGAEAEVERGELQLGDRPLEILGNAAGKRSGDPVKDAEDARKAIKIEGATFVVADPSLEVPAMNAADPVFHQALADAMDDAVAAGAQVLGADLDNPGAPATGSATISNKAGAGMLTMDSMTELTRGLLDFVARTAPGAKDFKTALQEAGGKDVVLPEGVYRVPHDLKLKGNMTITGSGTLIVDHKVELESGAVLRWTGQVLVGSPDEDETELRVQKGSTLDVRGVLAVAGGEKKAKLTLESGDTAKKTTVNVDGALLVMTNALDAADDGSDDRNEFKVDKAVTLTVDGVLAIVGEHVHFKVEEGADLTVNGSMSFLFPEDSREGLHHFEVKKSSRMKVTHDRAAATAGVEHLRALTSVVFASQGAPFPVTVSTYWEPSPRTLLGAQEAAIAAGAVGMEGL